MIGKREMDDLAVLFVDEFRMNFVCLCHPRPIIENSTAAGTNLDSLFPSHCSGVSQ
jgi:hypothetical protein